MKVAVTGGGGFIGSLLVGRLDKAGHDVVSLDVRQPRPSTVQRHHAIDSRNAQAVANAFIGCERLSTIRRGPWRRML